MSSSKNKIRVRFAPSPTGYLHVGGARTAIFNWLFARKYNGKFLLRIEDTDAARSGQDMVAAIIEGLRWLGLDWDEEVMYQSKRLDVYKKYAEMLISQKTAYKCFCTKEELEESRQSAQNEKRDYRYRFDRKCLNLTGHDILEYEKQGRPYVVRLRLPVGQTNFVDQVYGEISVHHEQLDDFIIMRSDGYPTYHLAVVVDDREMDISHIIRGDDHMSNTPKHILLYNAFGWQPPVYAHVPLILGPDKQRLSKRHGATAIGEYEKAGYLPECVLNFLTLLGWSSGDDRELFNRKELIEEFDLKGISKKSAVFDEKKLEWMNGQYILGLSAKSLFDHVLPGLLQMGVVSQEYVNQNEEYLLKIVRLLQPRLKRLSEFVNMSSYFFTDPVSYEEKAVKKFWQSAIVIEHLQKIADEIDKIEKVAPDKIEAVIRNLAEEMKLNAANLIHPLRLALTGLSFSPGIFEVMELLGKETVQRRIKKAIEYINPDNS